jgi:phosphoribosylformylglycinamidine (FGAM) synthase PurS component
MYIILILLERSIEDYIGKKEKRMPSLKDRVKPVTSKQTSKLDLANSGLSEEDKQDLNSFEEELFNNPLMDGIAKERRQKERT